MLSYIFTWLHVCECSCCCCSFLVVSDANLLTPSVRFFFHLSFFCVCVCVWRLQAVEFLPVESESDVGAEVLICCMTSSL